MSVILRKPIYLILFEDKKKNKCYLSVDKPDLMSNFVSFKGYELEQSEEEVIENFLELIDSAQKESMLEMILPAHKITKMRNLTFNPVKGKVQLKTEQ